MHAAYAFTSAKDKFRKIKILMRLLIALQFKAFVVT